MATAMNPSSMSSSTSSVVQTESPVAGVEEQVSSGVVRLKLEKREATKKVSWTNDTIDNEHLGRRKSKCCCVYVRPKEFDQSSSEESEVECEHCTGHVEKKKKKRPPNQKDPEEKH